MALYIDLYNLFSGSDESDELRNRVYTATAKAAQTLLDGTPTLEETKWASAVLSNPASEGQKMFILVIVKNSAATIAQITDALDDTLQTNVNDSVPELVIAYNA